MILDTAIDKERIVSYIEAGSEIISKISSSACMDMMNALAHMIAAVPRPDSGNVGMYDFGRMCICIALGLMTTGEIDNVNNTPLESMVESMKAGVHLEFELNGGENQNLSPITDIADYVYGKIIKRDLDDVQGSVFFTFMSLGLGIAVMEELWAQRPQ